MAVAPPAAAKGAVGGPGRSHGAALHTHRRRRRLQAQGRVHAGAASSSGSGNDGFSSTACCQQQ